MSKRKNQTVGNKMKITELKKILSRGEDSKHQFKAGISNPESLAAEMVAFSNSEGGILIIGADDDGNVIGLSNKDVERINQLISNTATNNIRSPINPLTENIFIDKKLLIIVKIKEGIDKPYLDNKGIMWVKTGSDKRRVTSKEELRRLFQSSDLIHADELPVDGTSIKDVDMDFFKEFYLKEYGEELKNIEVSLLQLFHNLTIAKDKNLNLAGLLLFGENPGKFRPAFIIKAVSFYGNADTGMKYGDSEDIKGKIFTQFKSAMGFLKRNLKHIQGDKSINSVGDLEIPEIVLEELIVNAILHRNYFVNAPVKLFVFENRIEIISPGVLPNKLTIENIKNGVSIIRNNILVSFASKQIPYRGIGTGIKRALKNYPYIKFVNDKETEQFNVIIKRVNNQSK